MRTVAALRTMSVCAVLALVGRWGWSALGPSLGELWSALRSAVDHGQTSRAVGFDALLLDVLAATIAAFYLAVVLSVLAVIGSAMNGSARSSAPRGQLGDQGPGSGLRALHTRRGLRLIAGLCGLGLTMSPVASFADGAQPRARHEPDRGSGTYSSTVRPSLDGLPMPDLPAQRSPLRTVDRFRLRDGGPVTVRPGDTLWRIAAVHLPAQAADVEIRAAVERWHARNRSVIGPDPDLIFPGMQLEQPGGRP
jgi:LysM domain